MCFTLALEGSQTSLRQESAESLSTPSLTSAPMVVDFRLFVFTPQVRYIHPLPFGTPPVSGGESVTTLRKPIVPLRQGRRGAKRRRGWINRSTLIRSPLKSCSPFILSLQVDFIDSCNYSPPYRASEVFRRSTECASVPREGRTFQFDARTGKGEGLPLSLSYIPCLSIFLYNA